MSGKQSTVRANGVDLNVVEAGAGTPTLVFLHYWGGSSRTWWPVIELLSQTNRCVAIDFRGWGWSGKEATDYRLETLTDDVIGVINHLGLEDFIVLGHSMGGKVAQLVAARRPKGLGRLILFAPAPPTPLEVPESERRGYPMLYETREGAEMVIGNMTPHPLADRYREQVIEDSLRGAPGARRAWPEQGMIQDISEATSAISIPVHIIVGRDDPVEPEASLRAAFGKVLRYVSFTILPGAGHMAPLEKPAELAELIRFLKSS